MQIKIVANNCDWKSLEGKLQEIHDWFLPKVYIAFDVVHTDFKDVPFKPYDNAEAGGATNVNGVDKDWYNKNVLPFGIGYDIVLFLMNLDDWKGGEARGWRTESSEGPVELQIGCQEDEMIMWPNFPSLGAFFQLARHEIMHALFMITGQTDTTHYWWNQGKLEVARDSINLDKNYRFAIISRALAYITLKVKQLFMDIQTNTPSFDNSVKLFQTAKSCLGTDASPNDAAPDELGCAETINEIYKKAFGEPIGGGVSTYLLYKALKTHPFFQKVDVATPGVIVISPTGYGGKNGVLHGHAGIAGENGIIMSNDSNTGKFLENFTVESWRNRFERKGGYPVLFYRRI